MIGVDTLSWWVDFTHAITTVAIAAFYLAMICACLWALCGINERSITRRDRRRETERAERWKRAQSRARVINMRDYQASVSVSCWDTPNRQEPARD